MATVTLKAYVENIAEALLTYTQLRLYRDADPAGAFSTLAGTAALLEEQEEYTFEDTGAAANSLWRVRLYNPSGPVQSDLSALISPAALTLGLLRPEVARACNAGFAGTCSANGTLTTLRDSALVDTGVDVSFLEGAWVYRPDAAAADDRVRRVQREGFDEETGDLSFARAFVNAPTAGEVYEVYNLFPPIDQPGVAWSWDRAVREGLRDVWFTDQVDLGPGTADAHRDLSLAAHTAYLDWRHIRRVILRQTEANGDRFEIDADTNGRYWGVEHNGIGNLTLRLSHAPTPSETVIVEFDRRGEELWSDADATLVPRPLAVAAGALAAFRYLNRTAQPGKYEREHMGALASFRAALAQPNHTVVMG